MKRSDVTQSAVTPRSTTSRSSGRRRRSLSRDTGRNHNRITDVARVLVRVLVRVSVTVIVIVLGAGVRMGITIVIVAALLGRLEAPGHSSGRPPSATKRPPGACTSTSPSTSTCTRTCTRTSTGSHGDVWRRSAGRLQAPRRRAWALGGSLQALGGRLEPPKPASGRLGAAPRPLGVACGRVEVLRPSRPPPGAWRHKALGGRLGARQGRPMRRPPGAPKSFALGDAFRPLEAPRGGGAPKFKGGKPLTG